jgi:glycosyltransferase involved in cell wall biosynthesis
MNKNILFFVSVTQIGGAESNVIKISQELVKKGYKVHFATLENNGPMFEICENFASSVTTVGIFYKTPIHSTICYWKLLKKYEIDVVLNFGMRVEFFSRIISKFYSRSIKVISNIRSTDSFRKKHHVLIDQLTFGFVSKWVSNSIAGKNAFVNREKILADRIDVIYNYIEKNADEPLDLVKIPGTIRVGVLANIRPMKGCYDLIKVAEGIIARGYNPEFICGGIDHTHGDFEKMIHAHKLERHFKLLGFVADKAVFFKNIDLFFLPSYMEGMPTVILEAMVYKKAVISTDIDGMPEQITHEYNGLLYPPGDITHFIDGILRIYEDDKLRLDFIAKSELILNERFGKESNIAKWLAVIND